MGSGERCSGILTPALPPRRLAASHVTSQVIPTSALAFSSANWGYAFLDSLVGKSRRALEPTVTKGPGEGAGLGTRLEPEHGRSRGHLPLSAGLLPSAGLPPLLGWPLPSPPSLSFPQALLSHLSCLQVTSPDHSPTPWLLPPGLLVALTSYYQMFPILPNSYGRIWLGPIRRSQGPHRSEGWGDRSLSWMWVGMA